jgi:hypothetical protein
MLIWIALGTILIAVLAFTALIRTAVRWGNQLVELKQFGVETSGTVLRKISYKTKAGHSRSVTYEYRDQFGAAHTRRVLAPPDAWDSLQEGGAIDIVYSQRRPTVSAPKYLVGVMKNANVKITINGRE